MNEEYHKMGKPRKSWLFILQRWVRFYGIWFNHRQDKKKHLDLDTNCYLFVFGEFDVFHWQKMFRCCCRMYDECAQQRNQEKIIINSEHLQEKNSVETRNPETHKTHVFTLLSVVNINHMIFY